MIRTDSLLLEQKYHFFNLISLKYRYLLGIKRNPANENNQQNKMIRHDTQENSIPYYPVGMPAGVSTYMISPTNQVPMNTYDPSEMMNDACEYTSTSSNDESTKQRILTAKIGGKVYQTKLYN